MLAAESPEGVVVAVPQRPPRRRRRLGVATLGDSPPSAAAGAGATAVVADFYGERPFQGDLTFHDYVNVAAVDDTFSDNDVDVVDLVEDGDDGDVLAASHWLLADMERQIRFTGWNTPPAAAAMRRPRWNTSPLTAELTDFGVRRHRHHHHHDLSAEWADVSVDVCGERRIGGLTVHEFLHFLALLERVRQQRQQRPLFLEHDGSHPQALPRAVSPSPSESASESPSESASESPSESASDSSSDDDDDDDDDDDGDVGLSEPASLLLQRLFPRRFLHVIPEEYADLSAELSAELSAGAADLCGRWSLLLDDVDGAGARFPRPSVLALHDQCGAGNPSKLFQRDHSDLSDSVQPGNRPVVVALHDQSDLCDQPALDGDRPSASTRIDAELCDLCDLADSVGAASEAVPSEENSVKLGKTEEEEELDESLLPEPVTALLCVDANDAKDAGLVYARCVPVDSSASASSPSATSSSSSEPATSDDDVEPPPETSCPPSAPCGSETTTAVRPEASASPVPPSESQSLPTSAEADYAQVADPVSTSAPTPQPDSTVDGTQSVPETCPTGATCPPIEERDQVEEEENDRAGASKEEAEDQWEDGKCQHPGSPLQQQQQQQQQQQRHQLALQQRSQLQQLQQQLQAVEQQLQQLKSEDSGQNSGQNSGREASKAAPERPEAAEWLPAARQPGKIVIPPTFQSLEAPEKFIPTRFRPEFHPDRSAGDDGSPPEDAPPEISDSAQKRNKEPRPAFRFRPELLPDRPEFGESTWLNEPRKQQQIDLPTENTQKQPIPSRFRPELLPELLPDHWQESHVAPLDDSLEKPPEAIENVPEILRDQPTPSLFRPEFLPDEATEREKEAPEHSLRSKVEVLERTKEPATPARFRPESPPDRLVEVAGIGPPECPEESSAARENPPESNPSSPCSIRQLRRFWEERASAGSVRKKTPDGEDGGDRTAPEATALPWQPVEPSPRRVPPPPEQEEEEELPPAPEAAPEASPPAVRQLFHAKARESIQKWRESGRKAAPTPQGTIKPLPRQPPPPPPPPPRPAPPADAFVDCDADWWRPPPAPECGNGWWSPAEAVAPRRPPPPAPLPPQRRRFPSASNASFDDGGDAADADRRLKATLLSDWLALTRRQRRRRSASVEATPPAATPPEATPPEAFQVLPDDDEYRRYLLERERRKRSGLIRLTSPDPRIRGSASDWDADDDDDAAAAAAVDATWWQRRQLPARLEADLRLFLAPLNPHDPHGESAVPAPPPPTSTGIRAGTAKPERDLGTSAKVARSPIRTGTASDPQSAAVCAPPLTRTATDPQPPPHPLSALPNPPTTLPLQPHAPIRTGTARMHLICIPIKTSAGSGMRMRRSLDPSTNQSDDRPVAS